MNRQIIFRAKTLNEGEWVRSSLVMSANEAPYLLWVTNSSVVVDTSSLRLDTLGQYTGIDDINGKRIFEGDIVRYLEANDEPAISVVRFIDCAFSPITEVIWMGDGEFEVLGNIFDNPELLGEKSSK